MKMDNEFFKKNLFWVLLVVAVPTILLAMIVLGTSVASIIAAEQQKISEQMDKLKSLNAGVKTKGDVELAREIAEKSKKQETEVWKDAYEGQNTLMTWPEEFEETFQFQNGFFAREIVAQRGAETPKEEAPADSGAGAADTIVRTLTGVLTEDAEISLIKVKVDKKKEPAPDPNAPKEENGSQPKQGAAKPKVDDLSDKEVIIYDTPKVKVSLGDGKEAAKPTLFVNLRKNDRVKVTYEVGRFFGDPLTDEQVLKFKQTYKSQIHPLLKIVNPINTKGEGVVQLGGWAYNKEDFPKATDRFLIYIPDEWSQHGEISKEIWLAQEDLWIQRDIYELIAKANNSVANFERLAGDSKSNKYRFVNPYWELDVHFDVANHKMAVTVKNLLPQAQSANITLRFELDGEEPDYDFPVQGGTLTAYQSRSFASKTSVPDTAKSIKSVKQVLTWETAAVKRIQEISIGSGVRPGGTSTDGAEPPGGSPMPKGVVMPGQVPGAPGAAVGGGKTAQSNRTFVKELTTKLKLKAPPAAPAGEPPGGSPMPGMPMGGMAPGGVPGGVPGSGGEVKPGAVGPNGFDFKRYSDVTPQARRVPVAVVLIIEQNHLTRVLSSFTSSKLRFLTTQVLINRYPNDINPLKLASASKATSGATYPGMYPGMFPGKFSGMPPMFGPPGAMSPPGVGAHAGEPGESGLEAGGFGATDNTSAHLEVVIYGNVSLYERFPARAKGDDPGESEAP